MSGASAGDVIIRPAVADDAALVLKFIRELAVYERLDGEVVATEPLLRDTLFGARPAAEVLLAFCDDEPAGFALFFQNYSTFLGRPGIYLEDLFVRRQLRGRGIGRALLHRVARIARDRDCGRLEWAVLDWNKPAIAFYESIGATAMNEWKLFRLTGAALSEFVG